MPKSRQNKTDFDIFPGQEKISNCLLKNPDGKTLILIAVITLLVP